MVLCHLVAVGPLHELHRGYVAALCAIRYEVLIFCSGTKNQALHNIFTTEHTEITWSSIVGLVYIVVAAPYSSLTVVLHHGQMVQKEFVPET